MAAKLEYKTLHISVSDPDGWLLLEKAHADGWRIEWSDYAALQYHFLLVSDGN